MTITIISISHLSSSPAIPNGKCIAWNFDGSNVVGDDDENEDLNRLRFENGERGELFLFKVREEIY
jgi:hypothetical protein